MGNTAQGALCWNLTGKFHSRCLMQSCCLQITKCDSRLEKIRGLVAGRVRIVLHGTNDFPEDIMKRCISGGVSKVNVNKLVLSSYDTHLKENATRLSLTKLMEGGLKQAQSLAEWQMDVVGSTGKSSRGGTVVSNTANIIAS